MSRHRQGGKHRAPSAGVHSHLGTGVAGATMVGIGIMVAYPPAEPAPITADIQLTSTGSVHAAAPRTLGYGHPSTIAA